MTREEASQILEAARPTGATHDDPRVAEALRMAARDPELARQLVRQREFDATMTAGVKGIAVPVGLKETILAEGKILRLHFWQDWRKLAVAAAAIVLLLGGGMVFTNRPASRFTDFRQELVAENWAGDPHIDFESADLEKLRLWFAAKDAPSQFKLPPALAELRPHGARVVEADGRKVSLLCLGSGARHFHLFVMEHAPFADLPAEGVPDFEKCGLWKTASWQQGNATFVLTGMSYQSFVSKFRKDGRWSISG